MNTVTLRPAAGHATTYRVVAETPRIVSVDADAEPELSDDGESNFAAAMREAYEFWGANDTEPPAKGRYTSTAR